jgi:phosphoglycolate phosphatase-like HAD superfamily hydrolase
MPNLFAFDFDGVISESLLEAYLITWRISGKFDRRLAPQDGPSPTLETIHRFREEHPGHWNAFSALVPFGNRCEDYYAIQRAVFGNKTIPDQAGFDAFRKTCAADLEAFHEEFYRERYALMDRDWERWLALNAPYPGVPEALVELAGRFRLAVATSKDIRSVNALLKSYGILELFEPGAILDKSTGVSKRAHLAALHGMLGIPYRNICFIDDKVAHLIDVSDLGVQACLAGWGYNGPEEHALARRHGFPVVRLEELRFLSPV